jgi:uncharacterized protein with FMN-binding domain
MNAKKIALPSFVIASFILYSLAVRHDNMHPTVSASTSPTTQPTTSSSSSQNSSSATSGGSTSTVAYKDGTYNGNTANAVYGNIQVAVNIKSGKITDVQFLQYPSDNPNSQYINQQAMPLLKQEALQAQSAQINGVSGATLSSQAFAESLSSALSKAQS